MTKSPAFQFYPKDWLSSLNVLIMSPAEEGAYIHLLAYCWDSGDCSIPDDDAKLSLMSRLGEGWFKGGSTVVRKCFIPHPSKPGFLTNKRLLEEHEKQSAWRHKSSEGGRKSASKRAELKAQSKGGSRVVQPKANRPVQPKGNSSTASSFAKDSDTKVSSSMRLPGWLPLAEWGDFKAMRKRMNSPMTEKAEQLAIRELEKLKDEGYDPKAVIEQSILRGWKSFFKLKGDYNANSIGNTAAIHQHGKSERARAAILRSAQELGYAE